MESTYRVLAFAAAVLLSVLVQSSNGVSQSEFFLHGVSTTILQRSSGPGASYHTLQLSTAARLYNQSYSSLTISSNGVVIFGDNTDNLQSQGEQPFTSSLTAPIIAPFWAQANYVSGQSQGTVRYAKTNGSTLLERASQRITAAYRSFGLSEPSVSLTELVVVTWSDIRDASSLSDGNTFQCVVAIGPSETFALFLYADGLMAWPGSPPALVGFSGEGGESSFIVPASLTGDVLQVTETGNTKLPNRDIVRGVWVFRIGGTSVEMPGTIVGVTDTAITVVESVTQFQICAQVLAGSPLQERVNIDNEFRDITTGQLIGLDEDVAHVGNLRVGPSTSSQRGCATTTINTDDSYEDDEQFSVTFSSNDVIMLPKRVVVTIQDDDMVRVRYVAKTAVEGSGEIEVCASVEAVSQVSRCAIEKRVTVDYTTFPRDAVDGVDYNGTNGTITMPITTNCHTQSCAPIVLRDDNQFENTESFFYTLTSNNSRVIVDESQESQEVFIMDDDARRVVVGLTATDFRTSEGESITVCVQMTAGEISHPVDVRIGTGHIPELLGKNIANGMAGATQDFIPLDEVLTFLPANPRMEKCVNVTTLRDNLYEETEYIGIFLSNGDGITLRPKETPLQIFDLNQVQVSVETTRYEISEGSRNINFCAIMTGHIERTLRLPVDFVPGTASAFDVDDNPIGDVDPDIKDVTFQVAQGAASRSCVPSCRACTVVKIRDDNVLETQFEQGTLVMSHSRPGVVFTSTNATLIIEDNDELRVRLLSDPILNAGISETSSEVPQICLEKMGFNDIPVTIRVIPEGVTATENEDFEVNYDHHITFPVTEIAETSTACSPISLTILDDRVVESNETIRLVAESNDPNVVVDTESMSVAIVDNDGAEVNFVADSLNVTETEGRLEVCVEMTGYTEIPLSVSLSLVQATARAEIDYLPETAPFEILPTERNILSAMYNLSVPERLNHPLPVSPPICTSITIVNDNVLEAEQRKQFTMTLVHPDPTLTIQHPFLASVTILDDDNVTIIVVSDSVTISITEGEGGRVCARMLGMADFDISAAFRTRPIADSAIAGTDYMTSEQSLVFPAMGEQLQCVEVQSLDDFVVERNEAFEVELFITQQPDMNIHLGPSSIVTVTIVDNDSVNVGFEAVEYSIVESEGSVLVCVGLTGHLDIPVSVEFSVRDPPERNHDDPDYVPVQNIALFENISSAASRNECVSIAIANDTILEDTEFFDVVLTSPDPFVNFTRATSRVYILDDDGVRVGLTERNITVPEENGQAVPICVEVVGQFQRDLEVTLQSMPISAQESADYAPISRTLTFGPSPAMMQRRCIDISIADDTSYEDTETFALSLQVSEEVRSAVSINIGEATFAIVDNDQVTLSLASGNVTLAESSGTFNVCVELSGQTEVAIPYEISVEPFEATLGSDFNFDAAAQNEFPPSAESARSQCHALVIVDDAILEDTEHLEAILTPPVGVARLQVGVTRMGVAISDDDTVTVGFNQTSHVVDEDAESEEDRIVSVCLEMMGDIEREVSVSVTSQPGTALDPDDFNGIDETIVFTPGSGFQRTQCVSVRVHEDREVEGVEMLSLSLSTASQGLILHPDTAEITIVEEDVVCLDSSLDTSRGYFAWDFTYPGEMAYARCENGTSTRRCNMVGEWEEPDTSSCYVSTNELFRYIGRNGFSMENFRELDFAMRQLLREGDQPIPKYVEIVDQILLELLDKATSGSVESAEEVELLELMLKILGRMQEWPQDVLRAFSSRIVNSFENIAPQLLQDDSSFTRNANAFSFSASMGEVNELFPEDEPHLSYFFERDEDGRVTISDSKPEKFEASIMFPSSLSEQLSDGEQSGLVLSYFSNPTMFPYEGSEVSEGNDTDFEMRVTPVVSASFLGHEIKNLEEDIIITLPLGSGNIEEVTCVSWSFEANAGLGDWVEDGCELVSAEENKAICACNHLTNFACLVAQNITTAPPGEVVVKPVGTLSILSIVGAGISILALALTILTLLVFGKLRKRDNTKFRIQLCLAMILMLVFFVTGIYQVETFEICVIASALLHYFTLVTAMWIAADALLMVLKLNVVFLHPSTCFIVSISLLCWLLPVPVVVVPIGISRDFTINDEYCFLSHSIVLFATLLGPIALLLVFTLLTFLIAGCCVLRFSSRKYKETKKASRRRGACRSIFSNLGVLLLFGVTWVFGAFTIREQGPEFLKYLFVGFNSLQGLFVFFFFVVFAKPTSDLWLQSCGCKERKKRKTMISAITGIVPPKKQKMALDANAERLRPMEEVDQETRLGMNTWDIMFVVPTTNQFDVMMTTEHSGGAGSRERDAEEGRLREEPSTSVAGVSITPSSLFQDMPTPTEGSKPPYQQRLSTLYQEEGEECNQLTSAGEQVGRSPAHSIDSARMSTADSGILMDRQGKTSPSPPLFQHPQSGSTPKHVHSVSGIGYVSAESSMEVLPQREEDCFISKGQQITVAPSLRPRAVPNEYSKIQLESMCS